MACEKLLGQTIVAVDLAEDQKALRFVLGDGTEQTYLAYGDCCSSTWIESIDDVAALVGGTVREVENLDLSEQEQRDEDDDDDGVIQFYGVRISTEKGRATIDYRNSSNGYYGGDLELDEAGKRVYGGVFDQNDSERVWKRLG